MIIIILQTIKAYSSLNNYFEQGKELNINFNENMH